MLRRFSRALVCNFSFKKIKYGTPIMINTKRITTSQLCTPIFYRFSQLPKHQVLNMPALSPTMSQGKVVKWVKKVGDQLEEGDIICQVETDKATVGFEVTEKGFLAQKRDTDQPVPVGSPLLVIVKKKQQVKNFQNFKFQQGGKKAPAKKQQAKYQSTKQQKPKKKQSGKEQAQKQEKPKKKQASKGQQKEQTKQQKPKKKAQQKQQPAQPKKQKKSEKSAEQQKGQQQQKSASYPPHEQIKMPALSPTMAQGKILKWNIKEGQQYVEGDSLCDIQTDKATVAFQATSKGVLAKIIAKQNSQLKVGEPLAVSVKNKGDADKFANFKAGGGAKKAAPKPKKQVAEEQQTKQEKPKKQKPKKEIEQQEQKPTKKKAKQSTKSQGSEGQRVFASPAAKNLAGEKGINLSDVGKGSGPQGRIIKQDVQGYKPSKKQPTEQTAQKQQKTVKGQKAQKPAQKAEGAPSKPKPKPGKIQIPDNPYEQIPLTNMRKTIAARLTQSKTTIPHYYISTSVQMDKVNALRTELNLNQKQNGVKISVNDIIVKAMALALRDFPSVNAQWHGNVVRRFKHADISVAVATQGGLITPIVYRADTLGLLDIAKRTKDIAVRARAGKLDPREYIGGTTTVSNVGMFGVDSVISVINPPQSTIVGVGKTDKKILFDAHSTNPDKPYRVAQVMELVVSADHRVVDGAVAAQWISRVKKYLEHPTNMLL